MVGKKDFANASHDSLTEIPNLHVCKLMQSLKSRGYVRETFNWQWYYWYLTEEGIEYLREYLHLPQDIVPKTHKKQNISRPRGGNDGQEFDASKEGGVGQDFKPNYGGEGQQGGFGRGSGGF